MAIINHFSPRSMKRIFAPLNVASLLFIILVWTIASSSYNDAQSKERAEADIQYVENIRQITMTDIVSKVNKSLPQDVFTGAIGHMKLSNARVEDNRLIFRVTNNDAIPHNEDDVLSALADKIGEPTIDVLVSGGYGLRFEFPTDHQGGYKGYIWDFSPDKVLDYYLSYHYDRHDTGMRRYIRASQTAQ